VRDPIGDLPEVLKVGELGLERHRAAHREEVPEEAELVDAGRGIENHEAISDVLTIEIVDQRKSIDHKLRVEGDTARLAVGDIEDKELVILDREAHHPSSEAFRRAVLCAGWKELLEVSSQEPALAELGSVETDVEAALVVDWLGGWCGAELGS